MRKLLRIVIIVGLPLILILAATYIYFLMFAEVYGSLPFNRKELSLLTQKAENRDAEACWCLYEFYLKDDSLGPYWLRKAAEYGYPKAQDNLYASLINKSPTEQIEALEWLNKAAAQNYNLAQFQLGRLYRDGKKVKPDLKQSEIWYRKAANGGLEGAMLDLSRLLINQYNSRSMIIEAYSWAAFALLRSHPKSAYADEAIKQQEVILQKAKALGIKEIDVVRESEPMIKEMEKNVAVDKIESSDEIVNDCLKIIGVTRETK